MILFEEGYLAYLAQDLIFFFAHFWSQVMKVAALGDCLVIFKKKQQRMISECFPICWTLWDRHNTEILAGSLPEGPSDCWCRCCGGATPGNTRALGYPLLEASSNASCRGFTGKNPRPAAKKPSSHSQRFMLQLSFQSAPQVMHRFCRRMRHLLSSSYVLTSYRSKR